MNLPPFTYIRKNIIRTSGIIFGILFVHLIGVYIYDGGKYIWVPGGSIAIGAVWSVPDVMNPLSYGKSEYDSMVFPFLFRGLIQYNPEWDIASGDLAQCDISKIEKITCILKNDQFWSDGTKIQNADIIATYRGFRDNSEDKIIRTLLQNTLITESKDGSIVFAQKTKDPLILKVLTYPIMRSDMVENAKTDRIATWSYITSWQYTLAEISEDTEYKAQRIVLLQNEKYTWTKWWLSKLTFKFFESEGDIEKNSDSLGFIIPTLKNEKLSLSARWKEYPYTTHEFFSLFFNTDSLNKNLRNSLHWQIGASLSGKTQAEHIAINNIFPTTTSTLPAGNLGIFSDIMRKDGYVKKDELLSRIEKESTFVTGSITYDTPKHFINKQNSQILFVDDVAGWVLLRGAVPTNIKEVIINNYKLREFLPGNKVFQYRITEEAGTIREWKNTYLLEGKWQDGKALVSEILTVYYSKNPETLALYKKTIDDEYIARNNTPALVAERERKKEEQKKQAETLDERYYYNEKQEVFSLKIAYITGPQSTEYYAKIVEDTLKNLSIKVELAALEPKDIQKLIRSGEKTYDIILIGVEWGDTIADVGQIFLSSNAKKWINFSNIESKRLDSLFESLHRATNTGSMGEIQEEITGIMQEESFFLPLSRPTHVFYVDRNLKWINNFEQISGIENIFDILEFVSIKDTYILNLEGKWPLAFIKWIFAQL